MKIAFLAPLLLVLTLWEPAPPSMSDGAAKDLEGLHNVVAYHEGFW
jgi:hypothetical protein